MSDFVNYSKHQLLTPEQGVWGRGAHTCYNKAHPQTLASQCKEHLTCSALMLRNYCLFLASHLLSSESCRTPGPFFMHFTIWSRFVVLMSDFLKTAGELKG